MLATLLLSQGVPMILHGDEVGRTQSGNNNVYCQDNETSWIDWADGRRGACSRSRGRVTRLRAEHPVFRRRRFFTGDDRGATALPDIAWLASDGTPMGEDDWTRPDGQPLAVFLNGQGIAEPGLRGEAIVDDSFLILFNPDARGRRDHAAAGEAYGETWERRARHRRRATAEGERGSRIAARGRRALARRAPA